jgi:hypothetical protein
MKHICYYLKFTSAILFTHKIFNVFYIVAVFVASKMHRKNRSIGRRQYMTAGKDPSLFGCLNIWDTNHSLQTRLVWEFLHIIFIWHSNHSLQTRLHFVWLVYDLHIIFIISCFSSFWLLASLRWRVHFCLHSRSQNKWLNLRILVHEITLWNSCTCFPCYPSTYHPCLLKAFEPGSFTSTSLPKYNALHYLYIPSSPILWWREKTPSATKI